MSFDAEFLKIHHVSCWPTAPRCATGHFTTLELGKGHVQFDVYLIIAMYMKAFDELRQNHLFTGNAGMVVHIRPAFDFGVFLLQVLCDRLKLPHFFLLLFQPLLLLANDSLIPGDHLRD